MNTIETRTYEYNKAGQVAKETITREEVPSGQFLRLDGLDEGRISDLVNIRNAFIRAANGVSA